MRDNSSPKFFSQNRLFALTVLIFVGAALLIWFIYGAFAEHSDILPLYRFPLFVTSLGFLSIIGNSFSSEKSWEPNPIVSFNVGVFVMIFFRPYFDSGFPFWESFAVGCLHFFQSWGVARYQASESSLLVNRTHRQILTACFLVIASTGYFWGKYHELRLTNTVYDFNKAGSGAKAEFLHSLCGGGTCLTNQDWHCGFSLSDFDSTKECFEDSVTSVEAWTTLDALVKHCGHKFMKFSGTYGSEKECAAEGGRWGVPSEIAIVK